MPAVSITYVAQAVASRIALLVVLILCVDHTVFAQGPLHDRVRSFVDLCASRRHLFQTELGPSATIIEFIT